tara:strand:+ start:1987 stop:2952 length:966 start_codon:yes stop_codon:yes gene_type:complete
MSATFREIQKCIESASDVLVVSHDRPDGDAIGSSVAMGMILEKLGKNVSVVNSDPVPDSLRFLPGVERVIPPQTPFDVDLVIALDAAGRSRISDSVWAMAQGAERLINIDHHISNTGYGDLNYVDGVAPATGQIVFQLARACGWEMDHRIAENLYAAISTDTGSFRYPSTSAETLRISGDLVDLGVNVGALNGLLYETYPRRRVDLLSYLLQNMSIDCDERYASVSLPLAVSRELGIQPGDTEGAIDTIRAIDSVKVAIFFEELVTGKIRVSSRSKDERFSVNDLCAEFGGGGHTLAAGARLAGPIESAQARVMEKVRAML